MYNRVQFKLAPFCLIVMIVVLNRYCQFYNVKIQFDLILTICIVPSGIQSNHELHYDHTLILVIAISEIDNKT